MKRGNVSWLTQNEAVRAIVTARQAGIPLLGFEGAFIREAATQPSLEHSWDYRSSAFPSVPDAYTHAITFITERGNGLHFELILGQET